MANFILKPTVRFFSSVLVGIFAPIAVLFSLGLCLGGILPLHLLLATIPLSALLSLLAAAPWPALSSESVATRWFVSLIIPVGAIFDVAAFLALFSQNSRYDTAFVVGNVIWALLAAGSTAATAHWLKAKAENKAEGRNNRENADRNQG